MFISGLLFGLLLGIGLSNWIHHAIGKDEKAP